MKKYMKFTDKHFIYNLSQDSCHILCCDTFNNSYMMYINNNHVTQGLMPPMNVHLFLNEVILWFPLIQSDIVISNNYSTHSNQWCNLWTNSWDAFYGDFNMKWNRLELPKLLGTNQDSSQILWWMKKIKSSQQYLMYCHNIGSSVYSICSA